MMLWLLLGVLALAGLAALLAGDAGTILGFETNVFIPVVTSAALLVFLAGSLAGGYRGRIVQAGRDLMVWVVIAFALVLAYSYRDVVTTAVNRVAGELLPPGESLSVEGEAGNRAVRVRRRPDGHFVVRTEVNGANATMLVDTGASAVVLTTADARAAGVDVQRLSYAVPVRTANGLAYAASIRLRRVAIGGIAIDNVDALVAAPGALSQSLLGMTFLTRLRSYEVTGEFMTLRI
jgi:aspartyl protease family protein